MWKSISTIAALAAAVEGVAVESRADYKGLVSSELLRNAVKTEALAAKAKHLERLAYDTPTNNRVIGSQGHEATVEWITGVIKQFPDYYTISHQGVPLNVGESANVTILGEPTTAYAVGFAPGGSVSGNLAVVKNLGCDASDHPTNATGAIFLISRGSCVSGEKVLLAKKAGAAGVLIYNNIDEGNLNGYSLQRIGQPGDYVPTAGISQGYGKGLVAVVNGGLSVPVTLSTTSRDIITNNIIVETIAGDHDNVIHVSGHSDSVTAGPGINDNGSGSISLLEIAIQLTNFTVKNAVRFSWWTGEEIGLMGAEYYVQHLNQTEKNKIRLMLDFDMMASPNYAFQIYDGDGSAYNLTGPPGSAEAEAEFSNYFDNIAKVNHTEIEFDGRSDYGPFLEAGIAAGGIACGAEGIKTQQEFEMFGGAAGLAYDVNYHEDGDNANNVNLDAWIVMARAIAHSTATYALSFDSLPPKNSTATQKRGAAQMFRYKQSPSYLKMI
ncbi:Zn-dependent exopeptidase [Byssothecium circinans]|uniref:Peptide hydrolase n=1 Tax=Byssothecium circinans TaxID=147558 RepID=A0A6A5UCN0_9PLEO|nr:Zn-dependent exopeptidase [Byssothecium circinans]